LCQIHLRRRRRRFSLVGRLFIFCALVGGTRHAKRPKAFVESLTEAVCYWLEWLKSSLEKLFGNPREGTNKDSAMLGSNQRPLPCEGSTIVCWRFMELAKFLQIAVFLRRSSSQCFRRFTRVAARLLHKGLGGTPRVRLDRSQNPIDDSTRCHTSKSDQEMQ
jgi:hypothetical protein